MGLLVLSVEFHIMSLVRCRGPVHTRGKAAGIVRDGCIFRLVLANLPVRGVCSSVCVCVCVCVCMCVAGTGLYLCSPSLPKLAENYPSGLLDKE